MTPFLLPETHGPWLPWNHLSSSRCLVPSVPSSDILHAQPHPVGRLPLPTQWWRCCCCWWRWCCWWRQWVSDYTAPRSDSWGSGSSPATWQTSHLGLLEASHTHHVQTELIIFPLSASPWGLPVSLKVPPCTWESPLPPPLLSSQSINHQTLYIQSPRGLCTPTPITWAVTNSSLTSLLPEWSC